MWTRWQLVRYLVLSMVVPGISSNGLTFASSKYRQNRKLALTVPTEHFTVASQIQCIILCLRTTTFSCVAVNFGPKGDCELLPQRVCDSAAYSLVDAEGFLYFDVDPQPENESTWTTRPCQVEGRCSGHCSSSPFTPAPPPDSASPPAPAPPPDSAPPDDSAPPAAPPDPKTTTTPQLATTAGPCGSGWWLVMNKLCLNFLKPGDHKGVDAMKEACESEGARLAGFDRPSEQMPAIASWLAKMADKAKNGGEPELPPLFVDIRLKPSSGYVPRDWIYTMPPPAPSGSIVSFAGAPGLWVNQQVPGETKDKPCVMISPRTGLLSNSACDDSSAGGLCLKFL